MLETSRGSTKSAFIPFEPRQVMLAKQNMAKKVYSETLENDSSEKALSLKSNQKKNKKSVNSRAAVVLHQSIAAYLNQNGFSKTLAAFQSEVLSEIDDQKGHSFDLEDMYYKYLESRKFQLEENISFSKELDLRKHGAAKKDEVESNYDVSVKPINKKKRKKNNGGDANTLHEQPVVANGFAKGVNDSEEKVEDEVVELHVNSKEKKKKNELISDFQGKNTQQAGLETSKEPVDDTVPELMLDGSGKRPKVKKKNKSKHISGSLSENIEWSQSETLLEVSKEKSKDLASSEGKCKTDFAGLDGGNVQCKDKKKKKNKPISGSFDVSIEPGDLEDVQEASKRKTKDLECSRGENKSCSQVAKLDTEDTSCLVPLGEENIKAKDKKRKKDRLLSESFCDEDTQEFDKGDQKKLDSTKEAFPLSEENEVNIEKKSSKKRKSLATEESESQADGKTESKEFKQRKIEGSVEPKTVNAFRRVKIEEVKFVDERLQDNSYWAKDGAEIGYGAKAQEVLGQVKGRGFRHEKTKKKRGSYRGGQIDLQTHSIKFNYSDDNE